MQRLGGSKGGGKITFGKLLDICGIDRKSVDSRFLSSAAVGLLPANFAGLGSISFCLGGFVHVERLQLDLLLSMKQKKCFFTAWTTSTCERTGASLSKRVSFFQRALELAIEKHRGLKIWQHRGRHNSLQRRGCDSQCH